MGGLDRVMRHHGMGHTQGQTRHQQTRQGQGEVILRALPLAVIGAFVALAVTGYATNNITGLAVSLQATVLPVAVITAGKWIAYSISSRW